MLRKHRQDNYVNANDKFLYYLIFHNINIVLTVDEITITVSPNTRCKNKNFLYITQ
jgi:hypothetical protein